jgi:aspartokinase
MISIADAARTIISKNPFICESLAAGLLNTSQYARNIQPQVEKIVYHEVKYQTIVTSLNRLKKDFLTKLNVQFVVDDVQLKYPVSDIVFAKTSFNYQKISQIYEILGQNSNNFLNAIEGNTETNIFVNTNLVEQVLQIFVDQKPIYFRSELAGIVLKFNSKYIDVPGSTFSVLRSLSMEGINLIEVVSTYTEITIFVDLKDSQRAIEIIQASFLDFFGDF